MANEIFVIEDKCTGCGACAKVCPVNCISMQGREKSPNDKWKKLAVIDKEACVFCNACVEKCDDLFAKTKKKIPDVNFFNAIVMHKDTVEMSDTIDVSLYTGVWCYAEVRHGKLVDTIYELLYIGKQLSNSLSQPLSVVLFGHILEKYISELSKYPIDIIYTLDHSQLSGFSDELYARALVQMINTYKPNKLLMSASVIGRSFSSRVAVAANTGITADATELSIDNSDSKNVLHASRPSFGGDLMATIICDHHRPEMATVRPMAFPKIESLGDTVKNSVQVIPFDFDIEQLSLSTEYIEFKENIVDIIDVTTADVIVAGGRGLRKKGGFDLLQDLADLIGGSIGATRPVVDFNWIPYRHQIGLTGRTVRPSLYIACGISGKIQHIAGMSSAKVIVSINVDPSATMMKLADFSIVEDLYHFIPTLVDELKIFYADKESYVKKYKHLVDA